MTSRPVPRGEWWARVAWSRLAEPEDAGLAVELAEFGHEDALRRLREGRGPSVDRFRPRLATLDVVGDVERARRIGARVVVPADDEWPEGLDRLPRPPHCLWVHGGGRLDELCERSVAVVGARAATPYGEHVAIDLAAGLADRGVTVVSGAAFGIDAAAHRGALSVDGPTVAVLACGLDRAYPTAHRDLIAEVAREGAVVSELPVGSAPFRGRFLSRNRLIATMTLGTVVVEAGLRSGSLNTARTASRHGRVVMAVPGPVTSMVSAGCHEAVRDGYALLVTEAGEVLDAVGRLGDDAVPEGRAPSRVGDELAGPARAVFDSLPVRRATSAEAIAVQTTSAPLEVLRLLGELEVRGLAERVADGWRRPRRGRRP